MVLATNLGFSRLGAQRELKWAIERSGKNSQAQVEKAASELRERHWRLQRDLGLDQIPSNDFSLYDHVLDTSVMVGAVPSRFRESGELSGLPLYFAMARGLQNGGAGLDIPAMEMTKWFDTNYHYMVPEFVPGQEFSAARRSIRQRMEQIEHSRDTRERQQLNNALGALFTLVSRKRSA